MPAIVFDEIPKFSMVKYYVMPNVISYTVEPVLRGHL